LDGYGMAKLCAGQMTRIEANQLGLHHNWVRVLSVYGPNDGEKTLVMSLIKNLSLGIAPECTFGDQIWDYLFSKDAALALRLIGEKGVNGKVYVLGSGEAKPLKDYIKQIQELVNPFTEIKYGSVPYSKNQVMFLQADITELVEDTGFYPRFSFRSGIEEVYKA